MAHERKCMICGRDYEYCAHGCKDFDASKPWMYLFDKESCKNIYEVWQSLRGKEIDKAKAVEIFKAMDLTDVLKANTEVAKEIKKIVNSEEKNIVEHVKDKAEEVSIEKHEKEKHDFHSEKRDFKKK